MDKALEAFRRGKLTRKKQDKVIDLFVNKVRNIGDMDALEGIKQQLQNGEVK